MKIAVRDISDKGRGNVTKKFKYEVGVLHTQSELEELDVYAKFRLYGDAWIYANQISNGNVYFAEVVIRS